MMKLETVVRSKNTPAVTTYAIGAAKNNKMKIFEITLNNVNIGLSPSLTATQ